MANLNIQNWIRDRYSTLLNEFKEQPFNFSEALEILQAKHEDGEAQVRNIISELQSAELLESRQDPEDGRRKIYELVPLVPDENEAKKLTRKELDSLLKRAADIIRTRVDYTYILLLLFYKRISDKWVADYKKSVQQFKKEGFSEEEAKKEAKAPEYHDLDLPQEYLWDEVRKDPLNLSSNLSKAMKEIADRNEDLRDVFTQFDFVQFTRSQENNEILRQLFELFSSYSLENASADILGDAYEFILRHFAPEKAKEGEVYTPREVVEVMVKMLDPQPGESVYDCALGSGGMLIKTWEYVKENYSKEKANTLFLYGQEQKFQTLALAKMNMLIHDIKHGFLEQGDTLRFPKFKDGGEIKRFDKGIFNPPWNLDGYGEESLKKAEHSDRFKFGYTTKQSADWAWMQHMLASIKDDGQFAVVLDTGAVSRGSGSKNNREKGIRKSFVDNDLIETVVLLPENLFYNTSAPGIIILVNKDKPKERAGKILLINASGEYEDESPQNELGDEHIEKMVETHRGFEEIEDFSKTVTLEEIKEADYNLSPSRFVFALDTEDHRDIDEIWSDIKDTEEEEQANKEELEKIISKLT